MLVAGCFRTVRRKDHAVPREIPRPCIADAFGLDVRIWRGGSSEMPLLLVTASKKHGGAVDRNRFRRRVRMAFLEALDASQGSSLARVIVWVRPGRSKKLDRNIPFAEIKGRLKQALCRLDNR